MSTRAPYGIQPSLFWESDQGRALQARGKDPVILSSYLRANPHATMIGLYRLRIDDVLHEQPVLASLEAVRAAFRALQEVGFAFYDEASACVWVREMARERLNLQPGDVLDAEDNRKPAIQRFFDALPPNPYLEPFFETYGRALRLKRRTFAQPPLDAEAPQKGLPRGLEGASAAGTSTAVPSTDQTDQGSVDQEKLGSVRTAPAAPKLPLPPVIVHSRSPGADAAARDPSPKGSNYHVIEKAAWDLVRDPDLAAKYYEHRIESETDLIEAVKRFCAKKKIDYGRHDAVPFSVVRNACASVWFKVQQNPIVSGSPLGPRGPRPR